MIINRKTIYEELEQMKKLSSPSSSLKFYGQEVSETIEKKLKKVIEMAKESGESKEELIQMIDELWE